MKIEINFEKKHLFILLAILILATGILVKATAPAFDPLKGWHALQQVVSDPNANPVVSVDANNNGIIDEAERISNAALTITEDGKVGIGTTNPGKKLEVSGTLGFSGGTGPFCIFAKTCPTGWVDKGSGGYIYANTGSCPYMVGGSYNAWWTWCHPKICCNE